MTDLRAYLYHESTLYDLPLSPQLQSTWNHFITMARDEISAKAGSTSDSPLAFIDLEIAGDGWRLVTAEQA